MNAADLKPGARVTITGFFLNGRAGKVVGPYIHSDVGNEWLVLLDGRSRPTAVRASDLRTARPSHLRLVSVKGA